MKPSRRRAPTVTQHPIAVVAERTGISQDVLRAWERRYGVVRPGRGAGGQRLYTDADVERLRLLNEATRGGRSISLVATLPTETLAQLVADDVAARERHAEPTATSGNSAELVIVALTLARSLDATALDEELRRAAARMGTSAFVESVAAPLLRRVGDEWHAGRLTPAQEHLVSSTVHDIVVGVMRSFPQQKGAPKLLCATLTGERHVIGAALVGAAAAVDGWSVLYLGADLPTEEIARAARIAGVRAVAVSVVYPEHRKTVLAELRSLRTQLPASIRLFAGGAGANLLRAELTAGHIEVEMSIDGLLASIRGDLIER
jgi:DNA-binding transcriptional MerR regulator/methylmalonyl-CoA mutase cobalamin-binding subunit